MACTGGSNDLPLGLGVFQSIGTKKGSSIHLNRVLKYHEIPYGKSALIKAAVITEWRL